MIFEVDKSGKLCLYCDSPYYDTVDYEVIEEIDSWKESVDVDYKGRVKELEHPLVVKVWSATGLLQCLECGKTFNADGYATEKVEVVKEAYV